MRAHTPTLTLKSPLSPLTPMITSALSLSALLAPLSGCHLMSDGSKGEGSPEGGVSTTARSAEESPQSAGAEDAHEYVGAKGGEESTAPPSSEQSLVARVNGQPITKASFKAEFEERVKSYRLKGREVPPRLERTYKLAVMSQLINNALLSQAVQAAQLMLTDEELEAAFKEYKGRFRSEVNFNSYLKQSNKSVEEVREQVRTEALVNKLLAKEADLEVSERELQDLYDAHKESRYLEPVKVRASHILISTPHNAPKRFVRQKRREALKFSRRAKRRNADFAALAKQHSADLKTRDRGGELGQLTRQGAPKISLSFEEAASQLELNTASAPVRSPLGWHIIKVTDRQPEQLRVSHILLKGPQAKARAEALLKRAATEPFDQLAKSLSQDEPSRVRGGDIGFMHPQSAHRLGPLFKEGVFKLKRGDLGIVESALGAHVVWITESRPERLRASHILISLPEKPTKAQVKEGRLKAEAVLEELKRAQSSGRGASAFTTVARKHSDDKVSSVRGGDLGTFFVGGQPHFSREVEEALFSMKRDAVSGPVRSPLGWHILKLTERLEARQTSMHDARAELTEELTQKKLRRARAFLMQRLRSEAKIERLIELESPR